MSETNTIEDTATSDQGGERSSAANLEKKHPLQQEAVIDVKASQLPLCCPLPGSELWNMHPRVFIDIETTGSASCPYCGAKYRLV